MPDPEAPIGRAGRPGRLRPILQACSLAIFASCLAAATLQLDSIIPVDLFFVSDPLLVATASLSSGVLRPLPLAAGTMVLLLTLLMGRVYCGYICPTGALLDLVRLRRKARAVRPVGLLPKYLLLGLLLAAAATGLPVAFSLDPISIAWRAGSSIFGSLADTALAEGLGPSAHPTGGLILALLSLSLLVSLNLVAPRFWCRSLCPLGALLSLLARFAPARRFAKASACTECGRCVAGCKVGALSRPKEEPAPGECIVCLRCRDGCPERAIGFGRPPVRVFPPHESMAASRRGFLMVGAGALAGVATARAGHVFDPGEPPLRPPGSLAETLFETACIRCTICAEVCRTQTLRIDVTLSPAVIEPPEFVPGLGGCDPECNACGASCPTGAIRPLSLPDKRNAVIGKAILDRSRCLRKDGRDCRICYETCPYDAMAMRADPMLWPVVIGPRCNGCGLCEFRCPAPPVREKDGRRRTAIAVRLEAPPVTPGTSETDERYLPPFLRRGGS